MTTRYVDGTDGNDANDGLAATTGGGHGPKKTINGCEDTPVTAGDLCHVRAGTYYESLTCDVSGSLAAGAIEYRGDYAGVVFPTGGVVRITGAAANEQSASRASCITAASKNYRTFRGFTLDTVTGATISATSACTNWTVDECYFGTHLGGQIHINTSGNSAAWVVSNCYFFLAQSAAFGVIFGSSPAYDNAGNVVNSCIFEGYGYGIDFNGNGGGTVRNCLFHGTQFGVLARNQSAGQTATVNNCAMSACATALLGGVVGQLTEDYNNIYACVTARSNVTAGANSLTYPANQDSRWFHEATNGGRFVTPFDLASYCALVNVAGTSPPAADLRGTTVQGAQREWGALEMDSTLLIESAAGGPVRILPVRGSIG